MRVAAVGAGAWGRNIIRTLASLDALACVVEPHEATAQALRADYPNIPFFSSLREAIAHGVDAVTIATPASTHADLARESLEAGKPTFVEKPLTLDVAAAEELVRVAEAQNVPLMVGHLLLYQPAVAFIADQIREGVLGTLRSVHMERLGLGRVRPVENVLWSLGVHDLAVMLLLVGEAPTRVTAVADIFITEGVEDDTFVHCEFPSGVKGHLHNSWLWPTRSRALTLIGSDAILVYDEIAQMVTLHSKRIGPDLKNVDEGQRVVFQGAAEPLKLEMEHFLECARTGSRPRSDGRSGIEVVRLLAQATEQMRG